MTEQEFRALLARVQRARTLAALDAVRKRATRSRDPRPGGGADRVARVLDACARRARELAAPPHDGGGEGGGSAEPGGGAEGHDGGGSGGGVG